MSVFPNDEQQLLQDQIERLTDDFVTSHTLCDYVEDGTAMLEPLWEQMAELGVLGVNVPTGYQGAGLGTAELCVVSESLGKTAAPVPFFSSNCLATEILVHAGSEAQKGLWLPQLAGGQAIGSFAQSNLAHVPSAHLTLSSAGNSISGVLTPVADAEVADFCIALAKDAEAFRLVIFPLEQSAIKAIPLNGLDQLRVHSRLEINEAHCEPLGGDDHVELVHRLLVKAALVQAFEQIGGAEAALYMARDYAQQRMIFGRSLGSYQATKHKLADAFTAIQLARANAVNAVLHLGDEGDLVRSASARIAATHAYEQIARENLQIHGGIGFTIEVDCHLHYRRSRLLALSLGSTETWSRMLIEALCANK